MKLTTLMISLLLIACTSKEDIAPTTIVGKWAPTYITQTKQADGTFDAWHTIYTLVALPVYEFTSDGRFLKDGKSGADACNIAGNKYHLSTSGKEILFSEFLDSKTVPACIACNGWKFEFIKGDTLILDECYSRNKYIKTK